MGQSPNQYLSPLHKAKAGRPLRQATVLWPRAGRLMLGERLWLKTQRLTAVRLDTEALSNVWWPLALAQNGNHAEKALVLWLNSTLGLLILLVHREETRGAWVKFKKPVLAEMPVIDIGALTHEQTQTLVVAYDRLCQETLMPFPEMHRDPTRAEIDEAISKALGLPDLSPLRRLLSQEPVVCLQSLC